MVESGYEAMVLRTEYYRDGFRKLIVVLIGLVLANVCSFAAIYYVVTNPPESKYFATSPDGRIVQIFPLDQPVYSDVRILTWSSEVVQRAFSFDFVNYRQQLQDIAQKFDGFGWRAFRDALEASRELKTVVSQKAVMTAIPSGAPRITNKGIVRGRYLWNVEVPVIVKMQGGLDITTPLNVRIQVRRVSLVNNPEGIAVSQFVAST